MDLLFGFPGLGGAASHGTAKACTRGSGRIGKGAEPESRTKKNDEIADLGIPAGRDQEKGPFKKDADGEPGFPAKNKAQTLDTGTSVPVSI